MAEDSGFDAAVDGVRALRDGYDEVRGSPEGRWLAGWTTPRDDDRRGGVDVLDLASGAMVAVLADPSPVDAVAWASPELLLVARGSVLCAHELPDGGIVGRALLSGDGCGALQVSRDRRRVYVEVTQRGRPRAVVLSLPALEVVAARALDAVLSDAMGDGWRVGDSPGVFDPDGARVALTASRRGGIGVEARLVVIDVRGASGEAGRSVVTEGAPPTRRVHLRWMSRTELLAAPGDVSRADPMLATWSDGAARGTARRFVEAPVRLPDESTPAVRAVDVDASGERALLTWDVFPQRRFQVVDRAAGRAYTVAVEAQREWEEVARFDPDRDDAMLVARVLGDTLRVERAPLAGGAAETLCARRVTTARAVLGFTLLPRGCGALVKVDNFPGRVRWLHIGATVFDRVSAGADTPRG